MFILHISKRFNGVLDTFLESVLQDKQGMEFNIGNKQLPTKYTDHFTTAKTKF